MKYKILLLIIIAIAAGFFVLLPHVNPANKKITHTTPKVSEKKDNIPSNCEGPNKVATKILNENEIDLTDKDCLYVGCNGFIY